MLRIQFQIRDWGTGWIEATHFTSFVDGANHKQIQMAAVDWKNRWAGINKKNPNDYTVDYIVMKRGEHKNVD